VESDVSPDEEAKEPEVVTNDMLYTFGIWLIKDVLDRLRRLEHVDLDPIRELAGTMVTRLETDNGLLKLALEESTDYNLATHLVNVATLAVSTGHKLGLPTNELLVLGEATLLHDVGHLHCGEELLNSEDRFDRLDFKMIKQHPQVGHDLIVNNTNGNDLIADIILQEHERDDGFGYPNYLTANEIHPLARIIGLCDFFEAVTHSRAHRNPLKPAEALAEIRAARPRRSERRIITAISASVFEALSNRRTR